MLWRAADRRVYIRYDDKDAHSTYIDNSDM